MILKCLIIVALTNVPDRKIQANVEQITFVVKNYQKDSCYSQFTQQRATFMLTKLKNNINLHI